MTTQLASRIAGVEVKAALTAHARDFRHLASLRDKPGAGFVHGYVVYLGERLTQIARG